MSSDDDGGSRDDTRQHDAPPEDERGRGFGRSLVLPVLAVLLVVSLVVVGLVLLRSLGDNLSGTSVERDSIGTNGEPQVRIANAAGRVSVEGVEGLEAVEYEVTKYAVGRDPADAEQEASGVPVDVSREENSVFVLETDGGRDTGADYAVSIPADGSVEVEVEAGDAEVSGISGDSTVLAEAGDVAVRGVGGDVEIEAPQGDVTVEDVNTDTGQAGLEVGSGDVELRDIVVGTLETRVEVGDVDLSGRFSGSGRISVETGSITATLPPEDTRELTLQTTVGKVTRENPPDNAQPDDEGSSGGDPE